VVIGVTRTTTAKEFSMTTTNSYPALDQERAEAFAGQLLAALNQWYVIRK
jgi:hypothetical protein